MPSPPVLLLGFAVLGALAATAGWLWLRVIGADLAVARRFAGARGLAVADVLEMHEAPSRPVRVSGRIRAADPLHGADDERLVAFHRDVEVRMPGGRWRAIERLRESRSFELWDHAGSLVLDPALAREPLITIPRVWEGSPAQLEEPHASAVARLAATVGTPTAARAITRSISVVDQLLVLAQVRIGADGPALTAPPGGYLISALELDAAMRLLGGSRRRQLAAALVLMGAGSALAAIGLVGALIANLAGA